MLRTDAFANPRVLSCSEVTCDNSPALRRTGLDFVSGQVPKGRLIRLITRNQRANSRDHARDSRLAPAIHEGSPENDFKTSEIAVSPALCIGWFVCVQDASPRRCNGYKAPEQQIKKSLPAAPSTKPEPSQATERPAPRRNPATEESPPPSIGGSTRAQKHAPAGKRC